jgi:Tol biopolymer transport system component
VAPVSRPALVLVAVLASACGTPESPPIPEAADTPAFVIDSSIYVISTEQGAAPVRLDSGFISPSWSPDGGTLAMVATGPVNPVTLDLAQALYLADADGGNLREISGFFREISGPALWAPDGTSLLIIRWQHGFGPDYQYIIRVTAAGAMETRVGPFVFSARASWSHDGSFVAVDSGGVTELIDPATNGVLHLIDGGWPQLSPVNDDLAIRELTTGHIHLIHPDSTADRDLQVDGYPLSWSPDGQRLAFNGTDGVYTIAPDGSGLLRIGPLDMAISDPAWSADGRHVAYVAATSSGPKTLYIAPADDSARRPIHAAEGLCCPAWRPASP